MRYRMNKLVFVVVLLVCIILEVSPQSATLGILDVVPKKGVSLSDSSVLTDFLYDSVHKFASSKYRVIARDQREEILKEIEFSASDLCDEINCAIAVGKYLSADYMIIGSLARLDGSLYLILRLVNVSTTEITASNRVEMPSLSQIDSWVDYCVGGLFGKHVRAPAKPGSEQYHTGKAQRKFIDFVLSPGFLIATGSLSTIVGMSLWLSSYDINGEIADSGSLKLGVGLVISGSIVGVFGAYRKWARD
jgi:hypothetical protein